MARRFAEDLTIFMSDQIPIWLNMREDDAEHDIADGMTQLRGENAKDQDKFRITVEREQAS